jgi:hypothetical protein
MTHKFFHYCNLPTPQVATYGWEFKSLTQVANRASWLGTINDPDTKAFIKRHLHDLRGGYDNGNNYKPVIFAVYDPEINDCPKLHDWVETTPRNEVKLVGSLMYKNVTSKVITYHAGLGQKMCRLVLHETPSQAGQEMFIIPLPQ